MNRSAFHAIRDNQQIHKYEALNTYTIYLNSRAAPNFVDGDAELGLHYKFTNEIRDNGSSHIKNAVARVKFIGTPFYAIGANNAYGSVNWNLSKNQYNTLKGGMSSEPLSMYNPKVIWNETYEEMATGLATGHAGVPAIQTFGGIMDTTDPDGLLEEPVAGNLGGVGKSTIDGIQPFAAGTQASLSDVKQEAYSMKGQRKTGRGVVGENFTDWVPCQNPFGKKIDINLAQIDQSSLNVSVGHAAAENTCIAVEIKLLPDNQANDKFSY